MAIAANSTPPDDSRTVVPSRVPASLFELFYGLFVTIFLLAGRWSPERLDGAENTMGFLLEPRFWCCVILMVCSLVNVVTSMRPRPVFQGKDSYLHVFSLSFLAYFAFTANWGPNIWLATDKAVEMGMLICVILSTWVMSCSADMRAVWGAVCYSFMVMMSPLAILGLSSFDGSRVAVLGGGPNVFARNLAILLFVLTMFADMRKTWKLTAYLALSGLCLLLIVASGSRGALAALLGATLLVLIHDYRRFIINMIGLCTLGVAAFGILSATGHTARIIEMFERRVISNTVEKQNMSGRDAIYETAYNIGLDNFWFGAGLNGYKAITDASYPHNIFLEAFAEGGIVGVLLLGAFVVVIIGAAVGSRNLTERLGGGVVVIVLLAAQFSGDMYDSRCVFALGVLYVLSVQHQRALERMEAYRARRAKTIRPAPVLRYPDRLGAA